MPIGPRGLHPDFVILHPRRGLLILEVKDWKLDIIRQANKLSFTILTDKGEKTVANPLEQARQYAQVISDLLQRDPMLKNSHGGKHHGRLCFPYGVAEKMQRTPGSLAMKLSNLASLDPKLKARCVFRANVTGDFTKA